MGEIAELGYDYDEKNILVEPTGKNTLLAICYGIKEKCCNEGEIIAIFPSDHSVKNIGEFERIINESKTLAKSRIITFGVKPNKPNTGYGYIFPGAKLLNGFEVREFKEKPIKELAEAYVEQDYFGNSGIFMFDTKVFNGELRRYSRHIFDMFEGNHDISDIFSKIG